MFTRLFIPPVLLYALAVFSSALLTEWSRAVWPVSGHNLHNICSRCVQNEIDLRTSEGLPVGFAPREESQVHKVCTVDHVASYALRDALVYSIKSFDFRPIFNTYFPVNIFVNNPPNISDEEQVSEPSVQDGKLAQSVVFSTRASTKWFRNWSRSRELTGESGRCSS